MIRAMKTRDARWQAKPNRPGEAVALCGSPHCDEVLADLRDQEPFGGAGLWQVVVRPGYVPATTRPAVTDDEYLVFSGTDASGREMREDSPPDRGRTLKPVETVYVRCKSRRCLAVTVIRGSIRWANVMGHLGN
jgi:hypothetical protein